MEPTDTLVSIVNHLSDFGDKVALRLIGAQENRTLTYQALNNAVENLARGLVAKGLGKGSYIAVFAPTCFEWFIASLAIVRAGACVVPIDVQLDDSSLKHVIEDSEVKLVFTTSLLAPKVATLCSAISLLNADLADPQSWKHFSQEDHVVLPVVLPDDVAFLFYTSGTTGRPKGVPLTHGMISYSLNGLKARKLVRSDDTAILPLPLHHVYPVIVGIFYTLQMGLETVLPEELTGPSIARCLLEGNVSAIIGVPRLYTALVTGIRGRAMAGGTLRNLLFTVLLSISTFARRRLGIRLGKVLLRPMHEKIGPRIRIMSSGGSKFDEELGWALEGLGWQAAIGYGLTETASVVSFCSPGDGHLDSVGLPMPGMEVRIDTSVNPGESTHEAPKEGHPGEIQVRGPNVFKGYHRLPEKTKEVFTEDGWFRTGDLGYIDNAGYLHVLGRASTLMVLPGGEKVQPEDVEAVYQQNTSIAEIAVMQKDGKLVAIVVPNLDAMRITGSGDANWSVRRALAEQSRELATYKRVTDFALTRESLPRTRLGKLRRHLLLGAYDQAKSGMLQKGSPEKIEAMSEQDREILADLDARIVWDWLCSLHPQKHLTLDTSPQLDLGVDSLEWLNITLEIRHRANVELLQDVFGRIETVRDLLKAVIEAGKSSEMHDVFPFDDPWPLLTPQQRAWLGPPPLFSRPILWCLQTILKGLSKTAFPLTVDGLENVPTIGQFILCPNHVSHLDPFVVAAAIKHSQLKNLWWGGWQGVVMHNPINKFVSRVAHAVPIDPRNAAVSSLAVAAAVLKAGHNLAWFPEGSRSPEGKLQTFRPGIGMLLQHFNVPVIPVSISGTFESLPMDKKMPSPHALKVVFGKPLMPKELEAMGTGEQPYARITNGLYEAVKTLGER